LKKYFLGVFTLQKNEIQGLNGIRAIAFFMLIYVHTYRPYKYFGFLDENPLLANFLNNGSLCMDAFFMLSGFLIGGQLISEFNKNGFIRYKNFFIKRVFRIFPPYYIFITLQYILLLKIASTSNDPKIVDSIQNLKSEVIWDYTYMTDYFRGTLVHGWSLSVEEKFYLLLPVLIFFFRYIHSKSAQIFIFLGLSLVPILFRSYSYFSIGVEKIDHDLYNQFFYYPFHSRMDSLFWGVFLASIYNYYPQWIQDYLKNRLSSVLVLGSTIGLLGIAVFSNENEPGYFTTVLKFFIVSILWSTILLKCLDTDSFTSKFLSLRAFVPVAKLSYAAYIIHLVFLGILTKKYLGYEKIYHYEILLWTIPIGINILIFAYFYYLLTEKPFMLLRERLLRGKGPQN
jgi:peptidoglycan/LPS O-acetylase OafA/YrhL